MAEPPRTSRRQRPDSTKMWEESEKRGGVRERDRGGDRDRGGERERERDERERDYDRGYDRGRGDKSRDRSRSPRDERGYRRAGYRERERGGRRDERERGVRGVERSRDYRDRDRERNEERSVRRDVPDRTRGEFWPDAFSRMRFALRERSNSTAGQDDVRRSREKDEERSGNGRRGMFLSGSGEDGGVVLAIRTVSNLHRQDNERSLREKSNERARSQSPRRNDERDNKKDRSSDEASRRSDYTSDRNVTPQPVSFSIGASHAVTGQDHDRMDVDGGNKKKKSQPKKRVEGEEDDDDDIVVEDDGMAAMQAMMGFGGFGTTQNKQVAGNNVSAVRKEKKTEYRQYMNRVGGFNRPLSPSRD